MRACVLLAVLLFLCDGTEARQRQTRPTPKPSVNQTMLWGLWWSPEWEPSAAFAVDDSTFYYPEHFIYRKYTIRGDSLHIFAEDGDIWPYAVVKLTADTLILSSSYGISIYTRTAPKDSSAAKHYRR